MLTFWWKYKKLKQIEVIKGSWNAWDIFTGLQCRPRLPHEPKHLLKTLNVFFLNQHLKIYHSTLFQKPIIEILRKRTVVINIEYG